MRTMDVAEFKERCIELLDGLPSSGLIITKRGKPIAHLIPIPRPPENLIGSLGDKIEIRGDILSTGVAW